MKCLESSSFNREQELGQAGQPAGTLPTYGGKTRGSWVVPRNKQLWLHTPLVQAERVQNEASFNDPEEKPSRGGGIGGQVTAYTRRGPAVN